MKKKLIAILMSATMTCGLVACSGADNTGADKADEAVEETADAAAEESAEETADDAEVTSETAEDGDVSYIKDKGTLVVGITDFAPMDYKDDDGNWIGFDADMAKEVAKSLGVDVEFVEIDWDNKILELENKSIDVVWNGMTLTSEVTNAMECTKPYLNNAQVVVVPSEDAEKYQTVEDVSALSYAVESGSAGEAAATENGFDYTSLTSQSDAVMEVAAGTSQACIIDLLMAGAMIGEGTSYENLSHTVELTTEEYGIGCRKGSDLAEYINTELKALYDDGTMKQIAEQYGVQDALIAQ